MKKRVVGGINAEQYAYTEVMAWEITYPPVEWRACTRATNERPRDLLIHPQATACAREWRAYTRASDERPRDLLIRPQATACAREWRSCTRASNERPLQ